MAMQRRQLLLGTMTGVLSSISGIGVVRARANVTEHFLVTSSGGNTVEFIDGAEGEHSSLEVGAAPWGIAVSSPKTAFVATAEGVARLDLVGRSLTSMTPYASWDGDAAYGEYRSGGMGIAVSPDERHVFTGVHLPDGTSLLEVLDVGSGQVLAVVPVGVRPFQVLASRDGREVYTIDHDSYTVTVISTDSFDSRTFSVSPLGDANGLAGFEKPHYAALATNGDLLLPFQGQVLLRLNPDTGAQSTLPLTASTHQHGIALSDDGQSVAIVGTGPAGGALGAASLTRLHLETGEEEIFPLHRPHECVAWSGGGSEVFITGGYTFAGGGWNGITVLDVDSGEQHELEIGSLPLDIVRLPQGE